MAMIYVGAANYIRFPNVGFILLYIIGCIAAATLVCIFCHLMDCYSKLPFDTETRLHTPVKIYNIAGGYGALSIQNSQEEIV